MNRLPLKVVAVSDDPLRSKLLDALLRDGNPHDVIFVESLDCAYGRIRRLVPDLIVVLARIDDEQACRLLTMLQVDRELHDIPVVTWATGEGETDIDHVIDCPVHANHCAMAHA